VFCQDLCKRITQLEKFEKSAAALHPLTRLPVAAASVASRRKALSVQNRGAEIPCDRLPHVRERFAYAPSSLPLPMQASTPKSDVLARMVGVGPAWIGIAAVVRGNHQQIGAAELGQEAGE